MSYRHRTSMLNLIAETGNDRTIGSQHISKTGSDELHRTFSFFLQFLSQRLYIDFTNTLRTSHHIRRINCLICRDHHKLLSAILYCQICQNTRTSHIHLYRFRYVIFHHRYMFVSSCMEYILRSEFTEYRFNTGLIRNIGYNGFRIDISPAILQFQTDVVKRCFCLVYQNQLIRIEWSNLTHDFTTDRAGSAGNHHPFSFQMRGDLMNIHLNRLTL